MMRSSENATVQVTPETTTFADRLRAAMRERGLSGAETARRVRERLGNGATFSAANLAHYTSGRSRPRLRHLTILAEVLGKPEGYFLEAERASEGDREPWATLGEVTVPSLHVANGHEEVWLQINQRVPWSVAVRVLQLLNSSGPD